MVILDWLLDLWLQQVEVPPTLQAFIDDWGILFRSDQQFDVLWTSLLRFTECLDLTMDMGKTRVWSTHADARALFRQGVVQVAHVSRNLGAHQNFTRHCWNSVLQQLLASLASVWM